MEAARLAAERGYTNIMVFRDGIPGWKKAGHKITSTSSGKNLLVPVIEAKQLNAELDDYLIIDIRPASIYKYGYILDSRAIPLPYLSILSTELPKDKKIVVVDHTGKQSKKAAQWLMSNGFKDVRMLKDGLTAYRNAGFSLQR
jgi:rhodanese-related sulfurtransferase